MENGLLVYAKCTSYTIHNCCVGTFIPFLLLFGLSVNHFDYRDQLFHFVTY